MVSPTARPTPRRTAARRPLRAAGRSTRTDELPPGGAEGDARLTIGVGHGLERVLADGDDDRDAHQGEDDAAVQDVDAHRSPREAHDEAAHHGEADEAPDDTRDGREQLDDDLERLAHTR